MYYTDRIEELKKLLQEPLPGVEAQNKMAARARMLPLEVPENVRQSAVLGLLYPQNDILNLLLIKRTEDGKPHSGQISFPGGRQDPIDKDLQETALRETFEEVGVPSGQIEVIGALSSLYIPVSNNNVHPFVGFASHRPDYVLNADEVQYVLEVPLHELLTEEKKTIQEIRPSSMPHLTIKAPAYRWDDDHLIWGATAMMIAELEEVLRANPF
ncbi:MAG: CoA pyrophosphatase [Chitinophagales bacterium]|nr:CoA pyrophosphatase [Chitinophagaceae bacterium]MCB9063931.1 CoA pyrophosphatase [Chitinophagales bacterium]